MESTKKKLLLTAYLSLNWKKKKVIYKIYTFWFFYAKRKCTWICAYIYLSLYLKVEKSWLVYFHFSEKHRSGTSMYNAFTHSTEKNSKHFHLPPQYYQTDHLQNLTITTWAFFSIIMNVCKNDGFVERISLVPLLLTARLVMLLLYKYAFICLSCLPT